MTPCWRRGARRLRRSVSCCSATPVRRPSSSPPMPLYEFVCDACGARVEKIQKYSDPPPDACAGCGKGPMVRQMSSPAIQFKGSGFYITDYAKKGGAPSDSASKTDKAEKTETKTDTAAASKSESSPAAAPAPAAPKPSSES